MHQFFLDLIYRGVFEIANYTGKMELSPICISLISLSTKTVICILLEWNFLTKFPAKKQQCVSLHVPDFTFIG